MAAYINNIVIQMDFESGLPIHQDLLQTITTMLNSLPGVWANYMMGIGYEITVKYSTYISYSQDEYMRFIDDTRRHIEELNQNYTANKEMYEVL